MVSLLQAVIFSLNLDWRRDARTHPKYERHLIFMQNRFLGDGP